MPFANHTPYDYIPRRLHPQEIGNPFNVINQFFSWENFPEWREHLNDWRDAALKPRYNFNNKQTLQAFVRYEFLEILIEGLFMIQRFPKSRWMPDIELYFSFELHGDVYMPNPDKINKATGYTNNYYAPRNFELDEYRLQYLTAEESKNPMGTIDKLFKKFTLPQWRDALYWWLIVSMDYTSADDSRGDNYLAELHLYLQKAIEAAHLIHIWNMDKWLRVYP